MVKFLFLISDGVVAGRGACGFRIGLDEAKFRRRPLVTIKSSNKISAPYFTASRASL